MTVESARKRKRKGQSGDTVGAREAFPGLPLDIVVTHILNWKNLPDPGDLAIIRAVSRGVRDAVDTSGRQIIDIDEDDTADQDLLSVLLRLLRLGLLEHKESLCQAAAINGLKQEIKVFRSLGLPWNAGTCSNAAWGGHFELLKWLRDEGCPWDVYTYMSAARIGHLELLKWAHANRCPWDAWTCAQAAHGGHFEVIKWARANGCPWDSYSCKIAASKGQFEILKWLRAKGCPWDGETCKDAVRNSNNVEMLKW